MNKIIAKKWVSALRSKKYKKGKHYLNIPASDYKEGEYCVLGVLVDLYQQDCRKLKKKPLKTEITVKDDSTCVSYASNACYLPPVVRKWAGLTSCEQMTMMDMNDETRTTFKGMARYIENNTEDLTGKNK